MATVLDVGYLGWMTGSKTIGGEARMSSRNHSINLSVPSGLFSACIAHDLMSSNLFVVVYTLSNSLAALLGDFVGTYTHSCQLPSDLMFVARA